MIAVIGLLAAIAFPSYQGAIRSSQTGASLAQLRQIHQLVQGYVADNGFYPPAVLGWGYNAVQPPFPDAGGATYWRRLVWNSANPSQKWWDTSATSGGYLSAMWSPLLRSKYGSVTYCEGHGSYAMHKYFHLWSGRPLRRPAALAGKGRTVPYLFAGAVNTNSAPQIGTGPYLESSAYPPTGDPWFSLTYEFGGSGDLAMGLYLDGAAKTITRQEGNTMNSKIQNGEDLP